MAKQDRSQEIIKRYEKDRRFAIDLANSFADSPIICKHFGCGKKLNATEYLYGQYCFKHQRLMNQKTVHND